MKRKESIKKFLVSKKRDGKALLQRQEKTEEINQIERKSNFQKTQPLDD